MSDKECTPKAVFAGVSTLMIVLGHPLIEISLQFLQRRAQFLAEGNGTELVLDGAVEAFANAVHLGAPCFGATGIDVLNRQLHLILVVFVASHRTRYHDP